RCRSPSMGVRSAGSTLRREPGSTWPRRQRSATRRSAAGLGCAVAAWVASMACIAAGAALSPAVMALYEAMACSSLTVSAGAEGVTRVGRMGGLGLLDQLGGAVGGSGERDRSVRGAGQDEPELGDAERRGPLPGDERDQPLYLVQGGQDLLSGTEEQAQGPGQVSDGQFQRRRQPGVPVHQGQPVPVELSVPVSV